MSSRPVELGSLKPGSLVVIDDEPCKVVSIDKSKPGKHGAAKARVVAVGIFDGVKRSIVGPVDTTVDMPIINKRTAQVISVSDTVQLMDLETYEVFEALLPEDEELKNKLDSGVNVEYWEVLGRRKIMRVRQ
jgi:translation initiation factor 5A